MVTEAVFNFSSLVSTYFVQWKELSTTLQQKEKLFHNLQEDYSEVQRDREKKLKIIADREVKISDLNHLLSEKST